MDPTLAGYLAFIRNGMRITTAVLPDDSPWIEWSYQEALGIVNRALKQVRAPVKTVWSIYTRAVYNLAGHYLVEGAPDVDDAPDIAGSDPLLPYFAWMRSQLDMAGFVSGVIQSTSDNGTGNSMVVSDAMKGLTFSDLQLMKSPWGRTYMGIAQKYGPSIWAVS